MASSNDPSSAGAEEPLATAFEMLTTAMSSRDHDWADDVEDDAGLPPPDIYAGILPEEEVDEIDVKVSELPDDAPLELSIKNCPLLMNQGHVHHLFENLQIEDVRMVRHSGGKGKQVFVAFGNRNALAAALHREGKIVGHPGISLVLATEDPDYVPPAPAPEPPSESAPPRGPPPFVGDGHPPPGRGPPPGPPPGRRQDFGPGPAGHHGGYGPPGHFGGPPPPRGGNGGPGFYDDRRGPPPGPSGPHRGPPGPGFDRGGGHRPPYEMPGPPHGGGPQRGYGPPPHGGGPHYGPPGGPGFMGGPPGGPGPRRGSNEFGGGGPPRFDDRRGPGFGGRPAGPMGFVDNRGPPGQYGNHPGPQMPRNSPPMSSGHLSGPPPSGERPRLKLAPRSKPVDAGGPAPAPASSGKPNPFGAAKPVDTAAKLAELDKKEATEMPATYSHSKLVDDGPGMTEMHSALVDPPGLAKPR